MSKQHNYTTPYTLCSIKKVHKFMGCYLCKNYWGLSGMQSAKYNCKLKMANGKFRNCVGAVVKEIEHANSVKISLGTTRGLGPFLNKIVVFGEYVRVNILTFVIMFGRNGGG